MRFGFMLAAALVLLGCAPRQYPAGRHYFIGAGLYTCPPTPYEEITQQEAERIESQGGTYYIAEYGAHGRIVALEKRLDRAVFFRQQTAWSPDGIPACTKRIEP